MHTLCTYVYILLCAALHAQHYCFAFHLQSSRRNEETCCYLSCGRQLAKVGAVSVTVSAGFLSAELLINKANGSGMQVSGTSPLPLGCHLVKGGSVGTQMSPSPHLNQILILDQVNFSFE